MKFINPGRTNLWLMGGLVLGIVVLVPKVSNFYGAEQPLVRCTPITYADVQSSVTTIGKVVPVNDFQARANFPGVIDEVCVRVGDQVHAGQLLIRMKDPFAHQRVVAAMANLQAVQVSNQNVEQGGSQEDHINMQADRIRAQLEYTSAENGLKALKGLQTSGSVSDAEIGAAAQRLQSAGVTLRTLKERELHRYSPTDIASWKTRVADAQANLDAQKVTFANANITSAISGTAYLIPARAYDFVPAGADLLHVANLKDVEVRALFDEPDMGKLHDGEQATITWEGRPHSAWHGHIRRAPLAAMASGTRNVGESIIALDNTGEELPPNTNVTVVVTVQRHLHVLAIPHEALHTEGHASYVFRVVDNKLRRTPVEVGLVDLNTVEITSGVGAGDLIAVHSENATELNDHAEVRIVK